MRRRTTLLAAAIALGLAPGLPSGSPAVGGRALASPRSGGHGRARHAITKSGRGEAPPRTTRVASDAAVAQLAKGAEAFDGADYVAAQHALLAATKDGSLANQDLALFLLASSEALLPAPDREGALARFRRVCAMQQSPWRTVACARAADLLFDLARFGEAAAGYRALLPELARHPEIEPAVVRFRLAEIAASAGDSAQAAEGFHRVFVEEPLHPLADRALERLRAIEPAYAVAPGDRIERAKRLTAERGWSRALEELALLPAKGLAPALRDEADYEIGITHFKMRHGYDVAAEKLLAVWPRLPAARQPDALFHGARAASRADEDDRGIAGYRDLIARFPHSKPAPEAAFLIGWLEFNRGRYKDAITGLEACLARYGGSAFADDAHWYLGYSKWLLGDYGGALVELDWLAKRSGALDGGKGRYWKARALEKLGREAEAVAEWRRLATDYPFTYYALSSRVRLAEHGVRTDPFGRAPGEDETRPPIAAVGTVDESLARDADVIRVDELLRAGMKVEASRALDRVDSALLARYGAARALPLLFDRFARAEDFFHVHRLAEAHGGAALRRDPREDAGARTWWERMYPLAYRRFVEKYGPTGKNPPYYLFTIMQKESAYNPHDVSYADAIGLLQMIPPTSRRVGARIARPYTDDVLYDPEGNIQFGAWYIGHLLEKFKFQIALGAGSYNAGPRAMMRWIKQSGSRPLDEFIELCAYTQTREYMKKALDIYAHYEWLWGGRDYLPSETIDAAYLDNEIDY